MKTTSFIFPYFTNRAWSIGNLLETKGRLFSPFFAEIIQKSDPSLSAIPTDRGAYIVPVNIRHSRTHVSYLIKEINRVVKRRIEIRKQSKRKTVFSFNSNELPTGWRDLLQTDLLYDYKLPSDLNHIGNNEQRELRELLVISSLTKQYPNISMELVFN